MISLDSIPTVVLSIVGLCVLVFSFLAITVKSRGNQEVSWSGFGVTFKIKPSAPCAGCKRK